MKLPYRFWYSICNLWYWKPRCITKKDCIYLTKLGVDDPGRAITELLLISVGLRVVDEDIGQLDGIYLTAIQEEAIGSAAEKGYYTGLR